MQGQSRRDVVRQPIGAAPDFPKEILPSDLLNFNCQFLFPKGLIGSSGIQRPEKGIRRPASKFIAPSARRVRATISARIWCVPGISLDL